LVIKSSTLTDKDLVALSLTLRNCEGHATCSLDFSNSLVSDDGITTLCAILQVPSRNIDSIICSNCPLNDNTLRAFGAILCLPHNTLSCLDLVNTNITDDGVGKLKESLKPRDVCKLDTLRLTLGDDGAVHLIEMLEAGTLDVKRLGIPMPKSKEISAALDAICSVKGVAIENLGAAATTDGRHKKTQKAQSAKRRGDDVERREGDRRRNDDQKNGTVCSDKRQDGSNQDNLRARVGALEVEVEELRSLLRLVVMSNFEQRIAALERR